MRESVGSSSYLVLVWREVSGVIVYRQVEVGDLRVGYLERVLVGGRLVGLLFALFVDVVWHDFRDVEGV